MATEGWRDGLIWADTSDQSKKKASFRDAFFFISDTETSVGRRNATHKYPFQDKAYVEDLGLDTDEFEIVGYVLGDNYFAERDALVKALKEEGPGILIHPFLGEKIVSLVGKARFTESFSEGGIARFTMSFVLSTEEKPPYPKITEDHISEVDAAGEVALNNAIDGA